MADIFDQVVRDLIPDLEVAVNEVRMDNQFTAPCESSIELAFAAALSVTATLAGFEVRWGRDPMPVPFMGLMIVPQVEIGGYRVDFLCGILNLVTPGLSQCVVVECDGHEWHERTKEQAAKDKARDRFLQTQVAKVLHFTGSELFRNPGRCAHETLTMALKVKDGNA